MNISFQSISERDIYIYIYTYTYIYIYMGNNMIYYKSGTSIINLREKFVNSVKIRKRF